MTAAVEPIQRRDAHHFCPRQTSTMRQKTPSNSAVHPLAIKLNDEVQLRFPARPAKPRRGDLTPEPERRQERP